jgi:hypothetical protein
MGRSFEVRRKSENLPVIGYTLLGAHFWVLKRGQDVRGTIRNGDPCVLASWNISVALWPFCAGRGSFKQGDKNRRFSRGNGGFFIGTPSRLGPDRKGKEKKTKYQIFRLRTNEE